MRLSGTGLSPVNKRRCAFLGVTTVLSACLLLATLCTQRVNEYSASTALRTRSEPSGDSRQARALPGADVTTINGTASANRDSSRRLLRCQPRRPEFVIYNRLPKCGSTTMREVIRELAKRNNFRDIHNGAGSTMLPQWNRSLEAIRQNTRILPDGRRVFVGPGNRSYTRGLFVNHVFYFSHDMLGDSVEYINIARHPLNQTQSHFYYMVDPIRGELANRTKAIREQDACGCADMTFGECVRTARERGCEHENLQLHQDLLQYLCGYGRECEQDTEERYQIARARLQQRYLFVGLTEHLELSAKVLERVLPEFFDGAAALITADQARHKVTSPYAQLTLDEAQLLLDYPGNKFVLKLWEDVVAQFWSRVVECELV